MMDSPSMVRVSWTLVLSSSKTDVPITRTRGHMDSKESKHVETTGHFSQRAMAQIVY